MDAWQITTKHLPTGIDGVHRALRDITAGVEAGRFHTLDPKLALAIVAGALLGAQHLSLTDPDFDDDTAYDHLAEHLLRMLGIPRAEARRLSTTALPDLAENAPTGH